MVTISCAALLLVLAVPIQALGFKGGALTTDSAAGRNLLAKARSLNDNNNNVYYNWIAKYSIKFQGCASIPDFEREEGMRARMLATFKLCPSDHCSRCPHPGEYVVELREFVEAVQNAKLEANEYNCEVQEESCEYKCENGAYAYGDDANGGNNNNNGDNMDYCVYQCMSDAGMSYCQQEGNDEQMDMEELSECRELGGDNNGNNNNNYNYNQNYQAYYVGAYCNSRGVFVGTFMDSQCSKFAPSGTFEKKMGYSLPSDPLVTFECISCKEVSNDGNNNNNQNNANNYYGNDYYDNDSVSEICEELYEKSGKCESHVSSDVVKYPDTSACELIHKTLPRLDRVSHGGRGATAATVLASIFGVMVLFMGIYIFLLHKRVIRTKVDLNTLGITA